MVASLHHSSSRRTSRLVLVAAVLALSAGGCASFPGAQRVGPAAPLPAQVQSGAHFLRGNTLELEGRLREAVEAYERAAALDPESAILQRHLAQTWGRIGDLDRAIGHAERALELDPSNIQVRQGLSAAYQQTGRDDEAIALLEPALADGSLPLDAIFGLINLYLEAGRLDDARAVCESMIEDDPSSARAYLALGAVLERVPDYPGADRAYRRALEFASVRRDAVYDAIARLYRRSEEPERERQVLEDKLVEFPDDSRALRRIARIWVDADEREKAIEVLEELVRLHPREANAQLELGFLYYETRRYEDAADRFHQVGELNPAFQEVGYYLGMVYVALDDAPKALAALRTVPPTSKNYPLARFRAARVLDEEKRYDEALVEMRRAVSSAEEDDLVSFQVYLAGLQQRSGDVAGAVATMEALLAADPDNPELLYELGAIHGEVEDFARALELMQRVLELEPDHAPALNYIGYTWADQGVRLDEAEPMLRRAVELKPDDGYIADSLGWVLYRIGLSALGDGDSTRARKALAESIDQLERALELLDPDDPLVTRHLADAYRSVSRLPDALAAYRRVLELDPDADDADEVRRQIELLELQVGRADSGSKR